MIHHVRFLPTASHGLVTLSFRVHGAVWRRLYASRRATAAGSRPLARRECERGHSVTWAFRRGRRGLFSFSYNAHPGLTLPRPKFSICLPGSGGTNHPDQPGSHFPPRYDESRKYYRVGPANP